MYKYTSFMGTSTHSDSSGGFKNKIASGRARDTFERYEGPEGVIEKGDIIVFDDPDAGMHAGECELIGPSEFVCKVVGVYRNGSGEPEVKAHGIGPVHLKDVYVCGRDDPTDWRAGRADVLLNHDEYDQYINVEYHADEDDVPAEVWEHYDKKWSKTGPRCPHCGNNGEPHVTGR